MVFRVADEVRPTADPGMGTVECAHMDSSPVGLCVTHVAGSTARPGETCTPCCVRGGLSLRGRCRARCRGGQWRSREWEPSVVFSGRTWV